MSFQDPLGGLVRHCSVLLSQALQGRSRSLAGHGERRKHFGYALGSNVNEGLSRRHPGCKCLLTLSHAPPSQERFMASLF